MRYDKTVYFMEAGKEEYDEATGDYITEAPTPVALVANITDMGADRMQAVFGRIVQGALIIRTKTPFYGDFDCIEYDGKTYLLKMARQLPQEGVYIVEEMQK